MNEGSNYLGNEEWKHHPTLPIQVSTLGRVRMGTRILEFRPFKNSYHSRVTIPKIGRWRRHTLVAETWLGWKSGTDLCVCHKDEELPIEIMDMVDNLWLGTRRENAEDRDRKGRLLKKQKRRHPDHVRQKIFSLIKLGIHVSEIPDLLNLPGSTVSTIRRRDTDTNNYINEGGV